MKNNTIIIVSIVGILIVISSLGLSMALHPYTLTEWWKPALWCALGSLIFTVLFGHRMSILTKNFAKYVEYPITFVFVFSILSGTFYSLNYFNSDSSTREEYKVPVVGKFSEERVFNHREGRRSYSRKKQIIYFIEIELNDGTKVKMQKPLHDYIKIKKGSRLKIAIEEGFFGIPVIKQ